MKTITLQEFKERNYDTSGISNHKLIDCVCLKCGCDFEYSQVKKFLRNRLSNNNKDEWETCQSCYLKIKTSENPEWVKKNSEAQKIAQNKPEQKKKNAEGVSKSWTKERRKQAGDYLKDRMENDLEFREKALSNLEWTQKRDSIFYRNIKNSWGAGGLKGAYNNIPYDSALELSFILHCEENNIPIKRYDLDPIKYKHENKERYYYPDFIINNNEVIEIKGTGLYYYKNYDRNLLKIESATEHFDSYKVIFSDDKCVTKNYKKARKLHYEIKEKNKD